MASVRSRLCRPLVALGLRLVLAPQLSARQRRRGWALLTLIARPPLSTRVTAVRAGRVAGEWLRPHGTGATPRVLYYLHGGGYVYGTAWSYRRLVEHLAKVADAHALQINYRLAPEHPFPAAVDDAVSAYRWLLARGNDPRHIVIAGDSAGGGLAVATLIALRDADVPLPRAAVLLSPWTDLAITGTSIVSRAAADPCLDRAALTVFARLVLSDQDRRAPLASPLYGKLEGLPPMLVQVGNDEVLRDDATRLAERAHAAGVAVTLEVWTAMWHVWQMGFGLMPESDRAIARIGEFLRVCFAD